MRHLVLLLACLLAVSAACSTTPGPPAEGPVADPSGLARSAPDPAPGELRPQEDLSDLPLRTVVQQGHASRVRGFSWSPDGRFVASFAGNDTLARVWDASTGGVVHVLALTKDTAEIGWAPDAGHVFAGPVDQPQRIWSARSGAVVYTHGDDIDPRAAAEKWLGLQPGEAETLAHGMKVVLDDGVSNVVEATTGKVRCGLGQGVARHAWSPDGTRLAVAREDKTVAQVTLEGCGIRELGAHKKTPYYLLWSPGSDLLLTVDGNFAKAWDLKGDTPVYELAEYGVGALLRVRWVGPAQFAVVLAAKDLLQIHDARKGTAVLDLVHIGFKGLDSVSLPPSPDDTLAIGRTSQHEIVIWDLVAGKLRQKIPAHRKKIRGMSWSPKGTHFASVGDDRSFKIWTVAGAVAYERAFPDPNHLSGEPAWRPDGSRVALKIIGKEAQSVHFVDVETGEAFDVPGRIGSKLTWSPDGTRLAAEADGLVQIWNGLEGEVRHINVQKAGSEQVLHWHPSEHRLVVATGDTTGSFWDMRSVTRNALHTGAFQGWSPDGALSASVGKEETRFFDSHGREIAAVATPGGYTGQVRWSPPGGAVAVRVGENPEVWDTRTWERRFRVEGELPKPKKRRAGEEELDEEGVVFVEHLRWSHDGKRIVTVEIVGETSSYIVRDGRNGKKVKAIGGWWGRLRPVAFSPSAPLFAGIAPGEEGQQVAVWNAKNGRKVAAFELPFSTALESAWSPGGERFALGDYEGNVHIWKGGKWAEEAVLTGHKDEVEHLAWSPDGSRLVSVAELEVIVWDVARGRKLATWTRQRKDIASMSWTPDSSTLQIATRVDAIVWEAKTGKELLRADLHTGYVEDAGFSADGTRYATASSDGSVRVWRLDGGDSVMLRSTDNGAWLAITDDGYFAGSAANQAGLAMAQGNRLFALDQIAPARNRPDKVLETAGASPELAAFYRGVWKRRLARLGLNPGDVDQQFSGAPEVRLTDVTEPDSSGVVQVAFAARDVRGLGRYQVWVDGVPVGPPVVAEGKVLNTQVAVQLTPGTNVIEVSATNGRGVESLRVARTVEYEAKPASRLFYLGFGVSDYADDTFDLAFAHRDALDLEAAFKAMKAGFTEVRTKTFTDAAVTREALGEAQAFIAELRESDTLVVFIAGHGVRDTDAARTYYYLDHDFDPDDLAGTAIPFEAIEDLLYSATARRKLFLIDTCQSGEDLDLATLTKPLGKTRGIRARAVRGFKKKTVSLGSGAEAGTSRELWLQALRDRDRLIHQDLRRRSGAIVLASSLGQESSLESKGWGNGAFTEEILRALRSPVADLDQDGAVSTGELTTYVVDAVPKLTAGRQHPNVERDNPAQQFALPIVAK